MTRGAAWIARASCALAVMISLAAPGLRCEDARSEAPAGAAAALEAVRQDLARKKFERALGALRKILDDPALGEDDRVQALEARSVAHAGRGELTAAEKDYRELLALRPGMVWEDRLGSARRRRGSRRHARRSARSASRDPPDRCSLDDGRDGSRPPSPGRSSPAGIGARPRSRASTRARRRSRLCRTRKLPSRSSSPRTVARSSCARSCRE